MRFAPPGGLPFMHERPFTTRPAPTRGNAAQRRGFTLVELMMVVAALAIMAGVVVPQVGAALDEAKQGALLSDLHEITHAIERYRIDHDGQSPDQVVSRALPQLTGKTNAAGQLGSGPGFVYGPYLDQMPINPLSDTANIYRVNSAPPANLDRRVGWVYHQPTGQIWAGLYDGPMPDLGGGTISAGGGTGN